MKSIWFGLMVLLAGRALGEETIRSRPADPIWAGDELVRLINETRVGEAAHYRNLMVYPLVTAGRARRGYWTLDQALAKGVLRISEKGEGNVPELLVENRADEPVFLLAGEIVTGGKQNRVISQDILLGSHSGPISLGVFCVEHGRWTQRSEYFTAEKELAHGMLREKLSAPAASQSAVWGEVARKSAAVAADQPNETQYLGQMYEDRSVKRNVDQYSRSIVMSPDANGMVVVIGSRVAGAEIFGAAETFGKLRDKLLRSYAVDALEESADWRAEKPLPRGAVEAFLRRANATRLVPKETIGLGRLLGIEGRGLYGSVLVWREQDGAQGVVHASLFAQGGGDDRPPVVPMQPRPLPRD